MVLCRHALGELTMMDVFMAGGAGETSEMEGYYLGTFERFVTFVAGNGEMASGEREAGGLMLIDGVVGCLEGRALMAALAAIEPWGRSELALVHILVAVRAARKIQLEAGVFAGGRVATGAGHILMREDDGEASLRMLGDCEGRRTPSLNRMAALAFAAIRAMGELTVVRIGLVTIGALRVRHGSLEVAGAMTVEAGDFKVFAEQGEAGL